MAVNGNALVHTSIALRSQNPPILAPLGKSSGSSAPPALGQLRVRVRVRVGARVRVGEKGCSF